MSNLKIFTENIEKEALEQIERLIRQPAFENCKVRIMPDVHAGAGCVIGFTADLGDKVIPNIVGWISAVVCLRFLWESRSWIWQSWTGRSGSVFPAAGRPMRDGM